MPTEICRHIKPNGVRCGSSALRGKARCYFHDRSYEQKRCAEQRRRESCEIILHPLNPGPDGAQREPQLAEYFTSPSARLEFPALEDRDAIQIAVSMLLTALGRNELDLKRAGIMLYGLQVASANAKTLAPVGENAVRETVLDETGAELAPDQDPEPPPQPAPDAFDRLLLQWHEEDQAKQNE